MLKNIATFIHEKYVQNFHFSHFFAMHAMVQAAPIIDCHAEFSRQASAVSSLSLVDFDRKMNSGWRVLADAKCFEEAGKIIKQYMEIN
ncbi:hypothetical protein [Janthinobacterium sp. RB2R34]|uniref:hypothetical protein n=1 Tax=Janthinobacterium sp. RB2R34 TaxID=3424193 RepID=UPI003F21FD29